MTKDDVNRILEIDEGYKMPDRLLNILFSEERERVFNEFLEIENNFNYDWFTEYFQSEQGDRNNLKQDFTPDGVCELVAEIAGTGARVLDLCAGTGGLTIKHWSKFKADFYTCIELSERALPMLLFNLCIRNVEGCVINGDAITGKNKGIYRLVKGERFSGIERVEDLPEMVFDICISNPPYSLRYDPKEAITYEGYPLAPASKADFQFILRGIHLTRSRAVFVLPMGVLFRGKTEGKIRQTLIDTGKIQGVIGLPDTMFANTCIPVCILITENNPKKDCLFIEASKEFEKPQKYKIFKPEHIEKILNAYKDRADIDKFARLAEYEEIKNNDYNLNIPRYVDTFEEKEPVDIAEVMQNLYEIDKEIEDTEKQLTNIMKQLKGFTAREGAAIQKWMDRVNGR